MNGPILHRGRIAKPPRIFAVRPLVREDLAVLRETRAPQGRVKVLRAQHHRLAYMLASGMTAVEVAEVTGYSYNRIHQLEADPTFQQRIAELEPEAKTSPRLVVDEFHRLKFENAIMAEELVGEQLQRALEDDTNVIPIPRLLAVSAEFGDRFGYGKHSSTTVEKKDYARMMEEMQRRSGRSSVIDAKPVSIPVVANHPAPGAQPQGLALPSAAVPAGIRRRV